MLFRSGSGLQWLDGNWPTTALPTVAGVARGVCPVNTASTDPVGAFEGVTFSNIRVGPIGSTT